VNFVKFVQGINPIDVKDIVQDYPIEQDQSVTFTDEESDCGFRLPAAYASKLRLRDDAQAVRGFQRVLAEADDFGSTADVVRPRNILLHKFPGGKNSRNTPNLLMKSD